MKPSQQQLTITTNTPQSAPPTIVYPDDEEVRLGMKFLFIYCLIKVDLMEIDEGVVEEEVAYQRMLAGVYSDGSENVQLRRIRYVRSCEVIISHSKLVRQE